MKVKQFTPTINNDETLSFKDPLSYHPLEKVTKLHNCTTIIQYSVTESYYVAKVFTIKRNKNIVTVVDIELFSNNKSLKYQKSINGPMRHVQYKGIFTFLTYIDQKNALVCMDNIIKDAKCEQLLGFNDIPFDQSYSEFFKKNYNYKINALNFEKIIKKCMKKERLIHVTLRTAKLMPINIHVDFHDFPNMENYRTLQEAWGEYFKLFSILQQLKCKLNQIHKN